jgi:CMP-N,N'-diacetyllegionaminic acid synthase
MDPFSALGPSKCMSVSSIALIPARGGSKGVPGKNMRLINGQPLAWYTINSALEADLFSHVLVSTDCPITYHYAKSLGATPLRLRPPGDYSKQSAYDLLKYHLMEDEVYFRHNQHIWYLQPTSPFRFASDYTSLSSLINEHQSFHSVVSVRRVPTQFHWTSQLVPFSSESAFAGPVSKVSSNRQELSESFYRDGAFYILRPSTLHKFGNIYGSNLMLYKRTSIYANIDNYDDFFQAESLCAEYLHLLVLNGLQTK